MRYSKSFDRLLIAKIPHSRQETVLIFQSYAQSSQGVNILAFKTPRRQTLRAAIYFLKNVNVSFMTNKGIAGI